MRADPIGQGKEHADFWAQQVDKYVPKDMPRDQFFCIANNEPAVGNEDLIHPVDLYNEAFADAMGAHGLRPGTGNISVGNPPTNLWPSFRRMINATYRNKGFVVLHEYWGDTGPTAVYPFNVGRLKYFPREDVPIFVGECGLEQKAIADVPHEGWKLHVSKEQYASQLMEYENIIRRIPRLVHSLSVFTMSNNPPWNTLDYREILPLLQTNKEFDKMMWAYNNTPPVVGMPNRESIIRESDLHQVIEFNPGAALQKAALRDGFHPNSAEFKYSESGKDWIAQRTERMDRHSVRTYFVPYGEWDKVAYYDH